MKIVFGYYEDKDFGLTEYSEIEFSPEDTKEDAKKSQNIKNICLLR